MLKKKAEIMYLLGSWTKHAAMAPPKEVTAMRALVINAPRKISIKESCDLRDKGERPKRLVTVEKSDEPVIAPPLLVQPAAKDAGRVAGEGEVAPAADEIHDPRVDAEAEVVILREEEKAECGGKGRGCDEVEDPDNELQSAILYHLCERRGQPVAPIP